MIDTKQLSLSLRTVTDRRYRFRKALKFLQKTYGNEGFTALWRGNSATMIRVVPYAAVQFTAYEQYKILLRPTDGGGGTNNER